MNFSTFYPKLNILFLILVLKFLYVCGQPSNSSFLVGLQTPNLWTPSLEKANSAEGSDQIDMKNETIFSNPFTENSIEMNENKITKTIDSSDESSAEVRDIFTTTTNSNINDDITTVKDLTQHTLSSDILSSDLSPNNVITSSERQELETIGTIEDIQIHGSTALESNSSESYSQNIFELETSTSSGSPIDFTTIADIRSQPLVLRENTNNDYINVSHNIFDINYSEYQPKSIVNNENPLIFETNFEKSNVSDEITTQTILDTTREVLFNDYLANTTNFNNKELEIRESEAIFTTPFAQNYSQINITENKKERVTSHYTSHNSESAQQTVFHKAINNNNIINNTLDGSKSANMTIGYGLGQGLGQAIDQSLNASNIAMTSIINNSSLSKEMNKTDKISTEEMTPISDFKTMCTFGGWSAYRPGFGRFDVNDLERADFVLSRCSHLIYAFAALDSNSRVISLDPQRELSPDSGTFAKLNALRKNNQNLKIMIGLGGWDTPSNVWTFLLSNSTRRKKTVENIIEYLKSYSFDGLLISWFYPGAKWRGGHNSDKDNLVTFLQELKSSITTVPIEIGIMGPASNQDIDDGFDVPKISNLVDYLLLMTYDYFGSWDSTVNHLAPLYSNSNSNASNHMNVNFTLHYWLNKGADPSKIILGLATYGRSFTLANPQNNEINAQSIGPGISGPYTNRPGIIGFNEICEIFLSTSGVKLEEDLHRITPFIYLYDQWIGFEDELSIFIKTTYALNNKLNGIFFWTLDLDDFHNKCGWGHFPLLRAALQAIYQNKPF